MNFRISGKTERYTLFTYYFLLFLLISALLRITFFIWVAAEVAWNPIAVLRTLATGLFFDIGTISFFFLPFSLYLAVFPNKWTGKRLDKIVTYSGFFLITVVFIFSFLGEITFWEEFKRRFNFIAVDYLVYTYEVFKNINESYPLPLLIGCILTITFLIYFVFRKRNYFKNTFEHTAPVKQRLLFLGVNIGLVLIFSLFITNDKAEWSENRYNNEISKAGIYSFFAAFRNNELSYTDFYQTLSEKEAFSLVKTELGNTEYTDKNPGFIRRKITDSLTETTPNVILICVESLSADVLNTYGSIKNITPNLDGLIQKSIWFENMYATGTRTVRGMEALTLSIPPTPGRSIVKRKNNENLFNVSSVFKQKGYTSTFFYGGDGYFDNMAHYFSANGFDIVDRSRRLLGADEVKTGHYNIDDNEATFENAWGVCDEDLYNKVLSFTDTKVAKDPAAPFFHFIMTTSNHRPYTYPEGKIDIPSGTGRAGAIKYTDYAIGEFIKNASAKPWFKNTVFIIVADHCASSAGKWELDVANYHIPALIYNLPGASPQKIAATCSQIDLTPTLFGLLHWSYETNSFGQNVLDPATPHRAFIGNYRKLGYMQNDHLMILGEGKTANFYSWDKKTNQLNLKKNDSEFLKKTIANYQMADYLYHNNGLKE